MKWMMGWMHDTLEYFQKIRCIESTIKMNWLFLQLMLFSENFMLPFHMMKWCMVKSILGRMPGW
jgi:1,4-alpha-glucan branching enzyme